MVLRLKRRRHTKPQTTKPRRRKTQYGCGSCDTAMHIALSLRVLKAYPKPQAIASSDINTTDGVATGNRPFTPV